MTRARKPLPPYGGFPTVPKRPAPSGRSESGRAAQAAGAALQAAIEDAFAKWRPGGVYLRRTPPPAEIVGSGADRRVKYVGAGTPDYHAIVRGVACPFDAKSTRADAWPLSAADRQREALDEALAAGARPGIYIQFRYGAGAQDFWLPWARIRDRASVARADATLAGAQVHGYAWWRAVLPE